MGYRPVEFDTPGDLLGHLFAGSNPALATILRGELVEVDTSTSSPRASFL